MAKAGGRVWSCWFGLVLVIMPLTACGSDNGPLSTATDGSDTTSEVGPQDVYIGQIEGMIKTLDPATLEDQQLAPIKVDTPTEFQVTISIGTIGPTVPASHTTAPTGIATSVEAGGNMGVTAFCQGVVCTAQSHERQNVLVSGDSKTWYWSLESSTPGPVTVTIVATTYAQATDNVLWQSAPITQTTTVVAGSGYQVRKVAGWAKGIGIGIGGAGTALAALWRVAGKWRKRRAKPSPDDEPSDTPGAPADS